MKLVFFYSSILVFASSLVAEEKKIEDCTKILDNNDRLSCFDSFFLTDKKQILVNQEDIKIFEEKIDCLLYTSPSPRDATLSRMPSSA